MKSRAPFAVFDISAQDGEPVLVALWRDESPAAAHAARLERDRLEYSAAPFPLVPRFYRRARRDEVSAGLAAGLEIL